MTEWFETLDMTRDAACRHLSNGVSDREAPARHLTLATIGLDGFAEARIVVLRGFSPGDMTLEIHTDSASAKCLEINENPGVSLLVWVARSNLQIRIRAEAARASPATTAASWARVPEAARQVYGGSPMPGTPIPAAEAVKGGVDPDRYAVLACKMIALETLHLGADRHRRALFRRQNGWAGCWIAP